MNPPDKDLSLGEIILELHRKYPGFFAISYGLIALLILAAVVGLWLAVGRGPRRRRGLRAARKLLDAGNWKGALDQLKLVRAIGSPSASWIRTFDEFEALCLRGAGEVALKEKKFEDALKFGLQAAKVFEEPEHDVRRKVQAEMLHEMRRLFSKTGETDAILNLVVRTLQVQAPCREASFWQAMCEIRLGAMDAALTHLQVARTGVAKSFSLDDGFADGPPSSTERGHEGEAQAAPTSSFLDPPLYLGAVLLRMGRAKDALRFLTEANRMESNCPFIRLQLGAAIVTAGGDTNMAVRALQFALGPKGLGQYIDNPNRAWIEGFPENRSYVRTLAQEFPFNCPLFGEDMKYLLHQGNLALALGQFKLGNFKEAAELFDKVLKEGAPSLQVLRGLGLSLARLERYDEAFIHLRTAHEMEEVKDRLTAGYLALCGAAGKPSRAEDKLQNIAWAIRLVTQFNVPGDVEWIGIINRIFAEARAHHIPLSSDDQLYLCEHLVSVKACDAVSAGAFHCMMATHPELVRPDYAWLYCQADLRHRVGGEDVLSLYAMTFTHADAAREFYVAHEWNLDEVELMFLRRAAEKAPGRFPDVLGSDYRLRGEKLLLAKAQELESAGDRESGLQTIEVLVKLSPGNTSAMDRAAGLHYRAGRLEPAFDLLEKWHQAQPAEPLPLVRQAILLHQKGNNPAAFARIHQAAKLATGRRRANIAFLGARVALRSYLIPPPNQTIDPALLEVVHEYLSDALTHDPQHPHAQWCLAAVRWLQGDHSALVEQAGVMQDTGVVDARYHYFAALCHLLGGQFQPAIAACQRVAQPSGNNRAHGTRELTLEAGYLAGLAQLGLHDLPAAIESLKQVVMNPASSTVGHAQAILGNTLFLEKRHTEAVAAWQVLDAAKRQAWGLVEPLAMTTFINALELLLGASYEEAAEKFRQAGRLGCRDRRLGPLLLLSLFKAGQQAIYAGETAPVIPTAPPASANHEESNTLQTA